MTADELIQQSIDMRRGSRAPYTPDLDRDLYAACDDYEVEYGVCHTYTHHNPKWRVVLYVPRGVIL